MQCLHPLLLKGKEIRCGYCMPCRIRHSAMWTIRILHELPYYKKSCFVTLTYDDKHLPENSSLKSDDVCDWLKRLRKEIAPNKIKYYLSGEYGEQATIRPHYHAILFGLDASDQQTLSDTWGMSDPYQVKIGTADPEAIAYTTSYILKKITGKMAEAEYGCRQPPFMRASQGIGLRWALANEKLLKAQQRVMRNGKPHGIPRYYKDKMDLAKYTLVWTESLMEPGVRLLSEISDNNFNKLKDWRKGDNRFMYSKSKNFIDEIDQTEINLQTRLNLNSRRGKKPL